MFHISETIGTNSFHVCDKIHYTGVMILAKPENIMTNVLSFKIHIPTITVHVLTYLSELVYLMYFLIMMVYYIKRCIHTGTCCCSNVIGVMLW